jgi:hypothetical protein
LEFAGAVILDAYNKGLGDFDKEAAFAGMKQDYESYSGGDVSRKLEKAYHAYFAMKMAQVLGKEDESATLKKASLAYREMWCPEQKDDQGNIRGFFTPDGKPVPGVEEIDKYAYEGNLWHYRWFVLHDVAGQTSGRKRKTRGRPRILLRPRSLYSPERTGLSGSVLVQLPGEAISDPEMGQGVYNQGGDSAIPQSRPF